MAANRLLFTTFIGRHRECILSAGRRDGWEMANVCFVAAVGSTDTRTVADVSLFCAIIVGSHSM